MALTPIHSSQQAFEVESFLKVVAEKQFVSLDGVPKHILKKYGHLVEYALCRFANCAMLSHCIHVKKIAITDIHGLAKIDELRELILTLPQVESLSISHSFVTHEHLPDLGALHHVHTLDITDTSVDDHAAPYLRQMEALTILKIAWNKITEIGAAEIGQMSHLEQLDISYNKIGNRGFFALHPLSLLIALDAQCVSVTARGVSEFFRSYRGNLRALNLSSNIVGVIEVEGLKVLILRASLIEDKAASHMITSKKNSSLSVLDLSDN
jgi:Leucine-rich repeat (LRR) protein